MAYDDDDVLDALTDWAPALAHAAREDAPRFRRADLAARLRRFLAEAGAEGDAEFTFDESKHPRGQPGTPGQFGPGGGGGAPPDPREASRALARRVLRQEAVEYAKIGLTPGQANAGDCLTVAQHAVAAIRAAGGTAYYGTPRRDPAHVWVVAGGLHYDIVHPDGVEHPSQLSFFQDEPDLLEGGYQITDEVPHFGTRSRRDAGFAGLPKGFTGEAPPDEG